MSLIDLKFDRNAAEDALQKASWTTEVHLLDCLPFRIFEKHIFLHLLNLLLLQNFVWIIMRQSFHDIDQ